MRILFATAELRPLVSSGGLGEAAAGLVAGLRRAGHEVEVVVPDYGRWDLDDVTEVEIEVPAWAGPARVRRGRHRAAGPVTLVEVPGIVRPHPYVDGEGIGWPDNDSRFAAFSAAVAAVAERGDIDVLQLNDWHTGLVPAFVGSELPTVLTIHNLAHQGWTNIGWLHELPANRDRYARGDAVNMLAGAIRSVDAVVAVSPTYAGEIVTPDGGMGLDDVLRARAGTLVGIRNGIDVEAWNPATDPELPVPYDRADRSGKAEARAGLLERVGWVDDKRPLVAMVTRLVEQKGVDLAFEAARYLPGMRARLLVLGSGERHLADWGRELAAAAPDDVWFLDAYDAALSHLLFGGADLFLMPSRFEPCGLAQMQAMAYGTIPVVTPVGGLADTVVDIDADRTGTGVVARGVDVASVVDALHRGLAAWRHPGRRRGIQTRGMGIDWSWDEPAAAFVALYESVRAERPASRPG
ncbi:MAG: glycogen synthase [Acidimicrobiales bacterium]